MSDQKQKYEHRVLCKNNIYLEAAGGKPVKVKAGKVTYLNDDELEHFGSAVTRDVPKVKKGDEPLPEYKRG